MKLLQKTNRISLFFTFGILLAAGLILYLILHSIISQEIEEQLMQQADRIVQNAEKGTWPNDPYIQIHPGANTPSGAVYSDTLIFNNHEGEMEVYRKMDMITAINGKPYHISVITSRIEWDELFFTVFLIFIGTAFVLLLVNFLINKRINRNIWHPFFNTMGIIREFSLKNNTVPHFQSSDIDEFNELNTTLEELIHRIRDDYNSLREFTENASHEIQTPLSVIHAGLDSLSQHPALDEKMAKDIDKSRGAAKRLSRLNRNLLLLTKMENKQFATNEVIDLSSLIKKQVDELDSLYASKKIILETELQENSNVRGNQELSEILISNLLSNMIRYTPENGRAEIQLDNDKLVFSNTGVPLDFPEKMIFDRFKKGDKGGSTGLGLAIAKQIAVTQKWKLSYNYKEGNHNFVVDFRSQRDHKI